MNSSFILNILTIRLNDFKHVKRVTNIKITKIVLYVQDFLNEIFKNDKQVLYYQSY